MKKIAILISIFLLALTCCWAGEQPDAVYHKILRSYKLHEDGTMDVRFRKELQLFSLDAFYNTYGETFIPYNSDFQTLTINEAYTVRKDGSIVQTPANAFNPSLPYGCTDCDRLNSMREMVVTHTALEYDATIVLDYTIHTQTIFFAQIMEQIALYEDAPIELYEIMVEVPDEFPLHIFKNYDESIEQYSEKRTDTNTMVASWTFRNLPQKPAEAYVAPGYLPSLLVTTVPSPAFFGDLMMNQTGFLYHNPDLYKEVMAEIVKPEDSKIEQVLAIRDYVANRIHTNDLSIRHLNYLVASSYTVWMSNCGTPFEKDMLLADMLRSAGFTCDFGVWYESLMSEVESTVRVFVDGSPYYISTAYTDNVPMDQRKAPDSFIAMTGEVTQVSMPPVKVDLSAVVSLDLKSTSSIRKAEAEQHTLLPAKELKLNTNVSPLHNGYYQLYLRPSVAGTPVKAASLNERRISPLATPLVEERYEYDLLLPAGARWVTQPYEVSKEYPFGKIYIRYSIDGNTMHVLRKLSVTQNIISTKDYPAFKTMMSLWDEQYDLIYTTNR
ncbi:MAG: DUF3857 domain-containing protein [Bacteroidales bacterium]|nr:DUF3857 domain-containing protein [Bacteroidales bacterium]